MLVPSLASSALTSAGWPARLSTIVSTPCADSRADQPGSAVALVVWLAMSAGLRYYVSNFGNYSATYGSIGGVILLMLWLYLSGVVLLLGAEVNAEIEHAAAARGDATAKLPGEKEAPAKEGKAGEVLPELVAALGS